MLTRLRVLLSISGLLLFGFAGATTVAAQVGTTPVSPTITTTATTTTTTTNGTTSTTAQLVEWDLPAPADATPGAVQVDRHGSNNGLWFLTRDGSPRVIHLQPNSPTKSGNAQWTSWELNPNAFTTGGIKRMRESDDRRFVYARTVGFVQAIDTQSCTTSNELDLNGLPVLGTNGLPVTMTTCDRYSYQDSSACGVDNNGNPFCPPLISDLTLDQDRNVYTALSNDITNSFIERLEPNLAPTGTPNSYVANVKLWQVGGGAGHCQGLTVNPCLSGIAVHPWNSNLIYYSEPDGNNIGELNICTNTVRRWSLTTAFGSDSEGPVSQPRQLNIDQDGIVWVVTGSGDLVSLDPQRNLLTRHQMPDAAPGGAAAPDPFGVAPDGGFIGYTASSPQINKVAMLIPRGQPVYVCPQTQCVPPNCVSIPVTKDPAIQLSGTSQAQPKTVLATITSKQDGIFVEAQINSNNDSLQPLGITPHPGKAVGTFFYAVGHTSNAEIIRVGFARLPRVKLKGHHEREDKDCNDDGSGQDDEDHDGIPNRYKTGDSQSHADRENDQLAAGQSSDYTMTAGPSTKALVAAITADNPLEPVSVQIIDPNGISIVLPVATPGIAVATLVPTTPGNYTVRVKNEGLNPINHETLLINREPLQLP